MIATTNDPATPYEWGKALSEQLESGILVTHRGEGHTIYAQGDKCIDDVVNAYLLNLAVPAEGISCGNGPPPPGEAAQATPSAAPNEGPGPRVPSATAKPPAPPSTGDGRDDGSMRVAVWAVVLAAIAFVLVGGIVVLGSRVGRRR